MVRLHSGSVKIPEAISLTSTGSLPNTTASGSSVFLSNIHCNGNEAMLSECSTSPATQCPRAEFAVVRCEGMTY
jgi:hypothetical protein